MPNEVTMAYYCGMIVGFTIGVIISLEIYFEIRWIKKIKKLKIVKKKNDDIGG